MLQDIMLLPPPVVLVFENVDAVVIWIGTTNLHPSNSIDYQARIVGNNGQKNEPLSSWLSAVILIFHLKPLHRR